MRYLVIQFLLLSTLAFAEHGQAACEISHRSVVSKTAAGIAQVGNLGLVQIRCQVGARSFPLKPGSLRNGLNADATVYNIAVEGVRKPVPSEVTVIGGGLSGETEWVDFYIHIPLEVAERDAEIRRYIATLERSEAEADLPEPIRRLKRDPKILAAMVTQNRAGRFQVECRVLDGETVIGVGSVGLDVLFTGHFFDALAPKRMTPP
jgi:hypothetical protein